EQFKSKATSKESRVDAKEAIREKKKYETIKKARNSSLAAAVATGGGDGSAFIDGIATGLQKYIQEGNTLLQEIGGEGASTMAPLPESPPDNKLGVTGTSMGASFDEDDRLKLDPLQQQKGDY
ncbi:hypothetical protein (Partial), partial [Seminavis robusta]